MTVPAGTHARYPLPSELIHELRTPLSQVIGYTEMIMEQAEDAGQDGFAADLLKVRAAGYHLLGLINYNFQPIRAGVPIGAAATIATPPVPIAAHVVATDVLAASEAVKRDAGQQLILVVDDIEVNRDVLTRRLTAQGYAVATADNGRSALQMLESDPFDLVLLDIMMPDMDGYEVLQRLKSDAVLVHIPVIMISAIDEIDSVVRCIELGADDYLTKPFNPTILKARIGASLEKKAARDREVILFEQLAKNYARLQELEKLRDDLTNMIVHDLRTPLTAVIAGMQMLDVMGELNHEQRKMMGIAIGGGETLLEMINDLLNVEKMEAGSMHLELAPLAAADLVSSAIAQVGTLANRKQLTILRDVPAGLPALSADYDTLRRVLVNLLGNAIKFTPVGGRIVVEVRYTAGDVAMRFSVTDTGEGIPEEAFDRIFDKFGQVDTRVGGRAMSTGLGLTFCRLAVEAHGGDISVESVTGRGSKFSFVIPLSSTGSSLSA